VEAIPAMAGERESCGAARVAEGAWRVLYLERGCATSPFPCGAELHKGGYARSPPKSNPILNCTLLIMNVSPKLVQGIPEVGKTLLKGMPWWFLSPQDPQITLLVSVHPSNYPYKGSIPL